MRGIYITNPLFLKISHHLCCGLRGVGHGGAHDEGFLVHVNLEGVDVVLVQVVDLREKILWPQE